MSAHEREDVVVSLARLIVVVPLLLTASSAAAWEGQVQLGLFNRLSVQQNSVERQLRYDPAASAFDTAGYLTPKNDGVTFSLLASVTAFVAPTSWLGVVFAVDTGELGLPGKLPTGAEVTLRNLPAIEVNSSDDESLVTSNGQPIADEANETFFIRQVFIELAAPETGWLALQGGRLEAEVARSLVYDDYALGARLSLDLSRLKGWPVQLEIAGLVPTRTWNSGMHSPLISIRIDYVFSQESEDDDLLQQVGLLAAYYHDGDDNFSRLFAPYTDERIVDRFPAQAGSTYNYGVANTLSLGGTSTANLGWIGLDATKRLGDLILSGVLLFEFGHVDLTLPLSNTKTVDLSLDTFGVALEVVGLYPLSSSLSLGGFFLFLSGEDNPLLSDKPQTPERFDSFLGVVPYVTHSNIFFSGGMNESFSGRQATTAGVNGRGVVALGPNVGWAITDAAQAQVGTALLWAPEPSMTGGRFYGFEMDLEGSYSFFDWLDVALEYDFFAPGSFFRNSTVIHRFMVGINLQYDLTHASKRAHPEPRGNPHNQPQITGPDGEISPRRPAPKTPRDAADPVI